MRLASASLIALLLGAAAPIAHAADLNTLQSLSQSEFRLLSEDLGAILSFKPLIPSEPLGLTGFDIGVGVSGTVLENRSAWQKAAGGASVPSTIAVPSLRAHKGLPFDIDVGVSVSRVPSAGITVTGGELRWAPLAGNAVLPAIALRASASAMSGVDQLKLRTLGFDVSVSKGFLFATPYAGLGTVNVKSKPEASSLKGDEDFNLAKVFAGVNLNFGLANLAFEADKTGKATSYSAKYGFRF
jgi:hypothetical protein